MVEMILKVNVTKDRCSNLNDLILLLIQEEYLILCMRMCFIYTLKPKDFHADDVIESI